MILWTGREHHETSGRWSRRWQIELNRWSLELNESVLRDSGWIDGNEYFRADLVSWRKPGFKYVYYNGGHHTFSLGFLLLSWSCRDFSCPKCFG